MKGKGTPGQNGYSRIVVVSVSDQQIQSVSEGLGITAKTVTKNLIRYLPDGVAQDIYCRIAAAYGLRVQDCARMLKIFVGPQGLQNGDDAWVSVGENMIVNKADRVEQMLQFALELNCQSMRDYSDVEINKPSAVALVMVYEDRAEAMVADMASSLGELRELFGLSERTPDRSVMMKLVNALVRFTWQDLDDTGIVKNNGWEYIEELLEMPFRARRAYWQTITWKEVCDRYGVSLTI